MAWTVEEIKNYHQIVDERVTSLYACAEIPEDNPDAREEYMKKILEVEEADENFIMNFSGQRERACHLNILERMAISEDL